MGLLKCLSPRSHSMKEKELRSELRQVKAQLAEAKITIADLKQGAALSSDDRIGTAPMMTSVAVQAKPPVECESRIPRPDDSATPKVSVAGRSSSFSTPRVSVTDAATGIPATAGGAAAPVSPGAPRSPQAGFKSPTPGSSSPARGILRSRIPASPSPEPLRRSQSCKSKPTTTGGATVAGAAASPAASSAAAAPDAAAAAPESPSEAGAAAGAFAASSSQARADFLSNQLKVAEAFRQSLESELREVRFKNSALQTQVLALQTKLERSMEAQVDEIAKYEKLRKGAGSADSRGYEEALGELAALRRKLEAIEADKTVAEQQAQAATELAADSKEQLSATQSELSSLKADLSTAQAKVLELTAEGARLKQQHIKLSKAQQRADDLEGALSATKAKAAASEADYKDCISRLEEELRTQKAISESTCEELLALSASHSELKQSYHKMECETKQHDQLVHIVQQELAEMSYFAAAGRVALGLCNPEDAPLVTGAVLVTPSHSGSVSPQLTTAALTQPSGASAHTSAQQDEPLEQGSHSSKLVEDTTAVCIAAAAAAGAAAAIAANPGSPRVSSAASVAAAAASELGSSSNGSRISPRFFKSAAATAAATANHPTVAAAAAYEAARKEANSSSSGVSVWGGAVAAVAAALEGRQGGQVSEEAQGKGVAGAMQQQQEQQAVTVGAAGTALEGDEEIMPAADTQAPAATTAAAAADPAAESTPIASAAEQTPAEGIAPAATAEAVAAAEEHASLPQQLDGHSNVTSENEEDGEVEAEGVAVEVPGCEGRQGSALSAEASGEGKQKGRKDKKRKKKKKGDKKRKE